MVAQNVFFLIFGLTMVCSALKMVTCRNVVHAALWLMIVLAGAAATFILLGSEFTATTQILVYLGAISILFVFGVMLTRAPIGASTDLNNQMRGISAAVGALLTGVFGWIAWRAYGTDARFVLDPKDAVEGTRIAITPQRTREVGVDLFANHLIPLQLVAVLLLVALIGAVTVARKD